MLFDEPNLKKLQECTNKIGHSQFSESMAHMYRLELCFENTPTLPQAHRAQLWGLRAAVTTWDSPHTGLALTGRLPVPSKARLLPAITMSS